MATNLEVGKYKNIGERTCVAPPLNFIFVPSSRNKHAVAKCCAQLGRVGKCSEVRVAGGGWALRKMLSPFLRLFVIAGEPEERWPNQAILALNPAYTTDNFFSCLFLPLDSRRSRPCSRPKPRLIARRYSMSIDWSLCYQCLFAKSVLRSHFYLLNEGW